MKSMSELLSNCKNRKGDYMNIAVLGANGKVGSRVVKEAANRGFDVTEIVRDASKASTEHPVIVKDVYELTQMDVQKFDVLVDALGFFGEQVTEFTPSTEHLLSILKDTDTRLIVVGCASSLYMDDTFQVQLRDTPDFPKEFYPLGTEMSKGLDLIKSSKNVNWTYISPAAEFSPEFMKKNDYVIEGEIFTTNETGESKISYDDYVTALVDVVSQNTYHNQRISVRWS